MLSFQEQGDLVGAVYDGIFEQPLWSSFLERLRQRTRSSYASVIFRPPGRLENSVIELFAGRRAPPELQHLYRQEIYKRNPMPYLSLREGRVYAMSELLDLNNPAHRAFFDDLLVPSEMNEMRIVRVIEPEGVSAWLTIARPKPDFSAADSAVLSAVAPHLRRALRNYVAIEREQFRASVTADVIHRLKFGWISLDADCRVIEINPHAEQLLRHLPEVKKGRTGRLTIANPALDREFSGIVKSHAAGPGGRPRALHISRDPWIDMLIVPNSSAPAPTGRAPVAVVYLQGDNWSATDRHEQIAELFGLPPSEARLALALSRGLTITEAAGELGVTVETARNYSKKIYAKIGARGQADLIRFILTSVLALS
jgi:DNA-binding CsgD family transcriptional regulator